jgi:hypothetical protein
MLARPSDNTNQFQNIRRWTTCVPYRVCLKKNHPTVQATINFTENNVMQKYVENRCYIQYSAMYYYKRFPSVLSDNRSVFSELRNMAVRQKTSDRTSSVPAIWRLDQKSPYTHTIRTSHSISVHTPQHSTQYNVK